MSTTLLLAQIVVVLLVARALGAAFIAIRQPRVAGEMLAGLLLGPSCFGRFWPNASSALFPTDGLAGLEALSHVGLLLFLFAVGAEADLYILRDSTRVVAAISAASMALPFGLGIALGCVMHAGFAPPQTTMVPFVLFAGVAMSVTAFPVLVRILAERGWLQTRVGAIALACAAVDDVVAWLLLAAVVLISRVAGAWTEMLWMPAATVAFVALLWSGVRPWCTRWQQRLTGDGEVPPGVLFQALAVLFVCAWSTHQLGVHSLFGAFLAGAIMPRDAAFTHALCGGWRRLVEVLLLPLFFVSTGLRTDVGLIASGSGWIWLGVAVGVATLGKFGGTFFAARWGGLNRQDAGTLGLLMNTRGLVELVVLRIGLETGIISPAFHTLMVLMALLTTFGSAALLPRDGPTSAPAKQT